MTKHQSELQFCQVTDWRAEGSCKLSFWRFEVSWIEYRFSVAVTLASSRKSMKAAEQNPPATNNRKIPIVIPTGVPSKVCRAVAIPLQTNTWWLLNAATGFIMFYYIFINNQLFTNYWLKDGLTLFVNYEYYFMVVQILNLWMISLGVDLKMLKRVWKFDGSTTN